MFIKLTDRDLVRRYGQKPIKVDEGMGLTLLKHGKGYETDDKGIRSNVREENKILRNYMDKMIRFPMYDKNIENDCIFPELCNAS